MEVGTGVEADLRRILWIQALRAFLYGFGTVVLGASLARSGLSDIQVAAVFTAILAGMALATIGVGMVGDRVGRRRVYRALLAVMGLAGSVFALTDELAPLVVMALTGTMSTDANESGPMTSLEQAMIGNAPSDARVHVFARYNAIAYVSGAVGALAAGGPEFLHRVWASAPTEQRWLLLFPAIALVCLVIAAALSPAVEPARVAGREPPLRRSRSNVRKLSALFAIDAFAGGFVVTTFVVFWFGRRFGVSTQLMSLIVFCGGLLQAGSSLVAARVGARIGLLNTMVWTHLSSNILLMVVPAMSTLGPAVALLLARFALSQMDVPTRQAYIAAMVDPGERTAAAAYTNTARYVARPVGPAVGGALMTNVGLGAPFVAAGALKCVYDLLLWRVFRRVPLQDDARTSGRPRGQTG